MSTQDILIGVDAGTSIIKAVAFSLSGQQLAVSSVRNRYKAQEQGAVVQDMNQTWDDCARAIQGLSDKVTGLAERVLGVSVTAQGDGTWLVDQQDQPVTDAWLWLDARSAPTVNRLANQPSDRLRFELTGTGLNTCQQGSQLAHMAEHYPELLATASCSLHCKDWLYLKLTGVRATDPSEACFTFGDYRTRAYDERVLEALGLSEYRRLLPAIVDGTQLTHPLTARAAEQTGLLEGTPVSLGYVDMVMTALGAGVDTGEVGAACSVIGSTGVHMQSVNASDVVSNPQRTGYVIALPIPNRVTQVQTNMASTLNLDWLLSVVAELLGEFGTQVTVSDLVPRVNDWLAQSSPGQIIYHPYISEAGERGPFVDASARASFIGLSHQHRFADLVRAVIEGLGMAMRDCYDAMGPLPQELRLSGGAARSEQLRMILAAATGASVRVSAREEAGAAGAAMMAAVANGVYDSMEACVAEWVTPLLGDLEAPDVPLAQLYSREFESYQSLRSSLPQSWAALQTLQSENR